MKLFRSLDTVLFGTFELLYRNSGQHGQRLIARREPHVGFSLGKSGIEA